MKYMLLTYLDEQALGKSERQAYYTQSTQLAQELLRSGHYLAAATLHPTVTATSVGSGTNNYLDVAAGKTLIFSGTITNLSSEGDRSLADQAQLGKAPVARRHQADFVE